MFCWVLNKCLIPETSPILHWLDENLWGNLVEILQERSNQPHGWRRLWTFKVELYLLFNYGESQAIAVIFWVILSIASYFKSSRWNSGTWFYEGKRFFVRFYKYLFYCCSSKFLSKDISLLLWLSYHIRSSFKWRVTVMFLKRSGNCDVTNTVTIFLWRCKIISNNDFW